MSGPEATLHWVGQKPTGIRAKDFVKCTDPDCYRNKYQRNANINRRRNGYAELPVVPHCHPVF